MSVSTTASVRVDTEKDAKESAVFPFESAVLMLAPYAVRHSTTSTFPANAENNAGRRTS